MKIQSKSSLIARKVKKDDLRIYLKNYDFTLPSGLSVSKDAIDHDNYSATQRFSIFVANSTPPLSGYLLPSAWVGDLVPAVQVKIDGKWALPFGLDSGKMNLATGFLRITAITPLHTKFIISENWGRAFRNNLRLFSLSSFQRDGVEYSDFYHFASLDTVTGESDRRHFAVATLWAYWEKHSVKYESRVNDLKALGLRKQKGGRKSGGKPIGEEISKGAFSILVRRTGVPIPFIPLTLAVSTT